MKPAILFLIKFVCLTVPLVWFWRVAGLSFYHALYSPVAQVIYDWLGLEGVAAPARDRFINIVPFLALMLLTPRLSARRRLFGTAIGLSILFAMHIAVNLSANPKTLALPRMVSLMMDAAPFFLWIVIANDFVRGLLVRAGAKVGVEHSAKSGESE